VLRLLGRHVCQQAFPRPPGHPQSRAASLNSTRITVTSCRRGTQALLPATSANQAHYGGELQPATCAPLMHSEANATSCNRLRQQITPPTLLPRCCTCCTAAGTANQSKIVHSHDMSSRHSETQLLCCGKSCCRHYALERSRVMQLKPTDQNEEVKPSHLDMESKVSRPLGCARLMCCS
jgi:hypothetical protein